MHGSKVLEVVLEVILCDFWRGGDARNAICITCIIWMVRCSFTEADGNAGFRFAACQVLLFC